MTKKLFVMFFAVFSCLSALNVSANTTEGYNITLGQTEIVLNPSPDGVPIYPWFPDGHISYFPDTAPGQYQMYWSGSSSYRTNGTSMMDQEYTSGTTALPKGSAGDFDNGGAWLMSVFRQSGNNLIGFFHGEDHEFPPDSNPGQIAWKSIAVCTSSDNGVTWVKGGQILTSGTPKPSTPTWGGNGDHCVVYDSVNSRWVCYYASPIALHMAISNDANGSPGTWKKYYNGSFNEDGLGGQESAIPGLQSRPGANPSVHYNFYLNKWVMVWHSWSATEGSIWLSTSTDMVNWDTPIAIVTAAGSERIWYPTIIGSSDVEAGQVAWLCYAYWPDQAGSPRQFLRRTVNFQPVGAPTNPTGLIAVALDGSVSLDWADNGEIDLMRYEVYRSTTSGSGYVSIQSGLTTSDYVDNTVTNGTAYYYVVTATDTSSNESGYSNQVSATPNPDIHPPTPSPGSFAIAPTCVSNAAVNMTATTGTDPSGPVEYLFTETSGNPGGTTSAWQTSPIYSDIGLNPSTQYTYTVRMRDAAGNTGSPSAPASATTLSSGLIQNGDFANVMSNWYSWVYAAGGRSADFNVVNGELVVSTINGGGVASWISIVNSPVSLAQGTTYTISFDARSTTPRFITVGPRKGSGDFASYSLREKMIDTTMKTYSFNYMHTEASDPSAQMIFLLGATDDTVYVDNLTMVVVDSGPGPGRTFKLLPIGDSITQGNIYGAGTYRKSLYYEMTDAGYNVDFVGSHDNLSQTGATDGRPDFDTGWDQGHEGWWGYTTGQLESIIANNISTYDFDVVLIHLGTNDPNDGGIQNLKDIIDILRTDNPNVVIFLAQLIAPDSPDTIILDFNSNIPGIVAEKNTAQSPVILVNQYNTLTPGSSDYADGLHPSMSGATKMAEVWLDAINEYYLTAPATYTLADVILALQVAADVPTTRAYAQADISGDGRIGLEEAINALVVTACTTPWSFNFILPESRGAIRAVREDLH